MLGIVITILAVLAVICFAFHYSDNTPRQRSGIDAFLNAAPRYINRNLGDDDLKNPRDGNPIVNRKR